MGSRAAATRETTKPSSVIASQATITTTATTTTTTTTNYLKEPIHATLPLTNSLTPLTNTLHLASLASSSSRNSHPASFYQRGSLHVRPSTHASLLQPHPHVH
ncbi:hypothetical protein E2C01_063974 [Portunus trituberculatus]|uniref:Uncharacterized protein n=1 Tax=Portunus trituberculatus TaxID=210409 RepID=A0A5B7HHV8_PORTR|nr:hypothetical protein [Portunus trituberculatus]